VASLTIDGFDNRLEMAVMLKSMPAGIAHE
jgi:hypothetical protein